MSATTNVVPTADINKAVKIISAEKRMTSVKGKDGGTKQVQRLYLFLL
jgi:hypothetical protein